MILDEADEMLDMGFREDIESILALTPAGRQTVLFSATLSRPIQELIHNYTRDPARVEIAAKALTVPTVEQVYFEVHRDWKFEALTRLIDLHDVGLGIVFCNTQRTVDELTEHLHNAWYDADALHGGMPQGARDRVMKKFKSGALTLLVATDVAGRGIDVNDVQVVFNFDLPYDAEDYVHRIGRTGRAGKKGLAVTLVSGREVFRIRHLERFTRQRIPCGVVPSDDDLAHAKETAVLEEVREVLRGTDLHPREHLLARLLEEGFDSMAVACALLHLQLDDGPAEPAAPGKAAARSPGSPAPGERSMEAGERSGPGAEPGRFPDRERRGPGPRPPGRPPGPDRGGPRPPAAGRKVRMDGAPADDRPRRPKFRPGRFR